MITIRCQCGETYYADEEHVGRSMLCRNCSQVLLIQPQPPSSTCTSERPEPEAEPETVRDSGAIPFRRHSHRIKAPFVAKMIIVSMTLAAMVLLWESEHRKPTTSLPNETTTPAQPSPTTPNDIKRKPPAPPLKGPNQEPGQEREAQLAPEDRTEERAATPPKSDGGWRKLTPREVLTDPSWHKLPQNVKEYALSELWPKYRALPDDQKAEYWDPARTNADYWAALYAKADAEEAAAGAGQSAAASATRELLEPENPVSLPVGAAPFGPGIRSGASIVTFDNGTDTDALVRLIRVQGGVEEKIRNFYLPGAEKFTAHEIPAGRYVVRTAFGKDWNATTRRFNFRQSFSETAAFEVTQKEWTEYTTQGLVHHTDATNLSITLHKVLNGNLSSRPISEAEFWR